MDVKQWQAYRWLLSVCGRGVALVLVLCLLQTAMALIGVNYALIMRDAIDAAVNHDATVFWRMASIFAAVLSVQVLLRAATIYLNEVCRASMDNRLRARVFDGMLHADVARMSPYHSGELMNRLTSDVTVVSDAVTTLAPMVLAMGVRIVGVVTLMVMLSPTLTAVLVCGGFVMVGCSSMLRRPLKRMHKQTQEVEGRVRSFMQESLENLLVIRAFGVGGRILKKADIAMAMHRRIRLHRAAFSDVASTGLNIAMQGGYVVGFLWCGYELLHGAISYGTLMAVIQLIGQIQTPFASLGGMFPRHAAMLASIERLMDMVPGNDTSDDTASVHTVSQVVSSVPVPTDVPLLYAAMTALRFDHVTFTYGRNMVLDDYSIVIRKGDFVAITGRSGIGKSTLMKLLLGAYSPQSGTVTLEMVTTMGPRLLVPGHIPAGFFAYVPQGNGLMSGAIREVVAFADRNADPEHIDDERVRRACAIADASGFIEELPHGYDTVLGEHGAGLSEGQMQRLAIARALYSEAPVLLLDESTSALDVDTERTVLGRIRAMRNRTVLIVTHRSEVLNYCDDVVYLGSHDHGTDSMNTIDRQYDE